MCEVPGVILCQLILQHGVPRDERPRWKPSFAKTLAKVCREQNERHWHKCRTQIDYESVGAERGN